MRGSSTDRSSSRRRAFVAATLIAVALSVSPSVPASAAAPGVVLTPNQSAARNALNRDRVLRKLKPLVSRADAQVKAQAWAARLARDGRLYHSRLTDGIQGHWCSIGENVGRTNAPNPVADVQARFMASPIHRSNILAPRFNSVGVGYATSGGYVYVVQVFVKTC